MCDENCVIGNFYMVCGLLIFVCEGLMFLVVEMDIWLKELLKEMYIGYVEDLGNGLIV